MNRRASRSFMLPVFVFELLPIFAWADGEPVKLAGAARFDLSADASVGKIENGRVIDGNGSIERKNWASETEQPRGYTVNVPVTHLTWRRFAVRFQPAHSGTVTLTLMGPYEEASRGVTYRQEVLWDDVRTEGAVLSDGGFESGSGAQATTWQSGGGTVITQSADVPAVEGTHYARTWHNQTLSANLNVNGGQPVVLHIRARAVRIPGLRDMQPIVSRETPAHRAARSFRHGANLGNGPEAPPGQDWGVHYSPSDLRIMRSEGFDHVRIPIGWHHYTGPGPEFKTSSPLAFRGTIDQAHEWSEYFGRPIHIGEFGCFTTADPVWRANYYRALREMAEKAGMGWAIWDWKAGFKYWDDKTGKPEPGMHEALFGQGSARTIN